MPKPQSLSISAIAISALIGLAGTASAQGKWFAFPGSEDIQTLDMIAHQGMVYGGLANGRSMFRVKDDGTGYQEMKDAVNGQSVNAFHGVGDAVYAGTMTDMYRSTNKGSSWTRIGKPPTSDINDIDGDANLLVAATDDGIYTSRDGGTTWTESLRLDVGFDDVSIAVKGEDIFASWNESWLSHSKDGGKTWTEVPATGTRKERGVKVLLLGQKLLVFTKDSLHFSPDKGATWTKNASQQALFGSSFFLVGSMSYSNGYVFAQRGSAFSMFSMVSADSGVTWTNYDMPDWTHAMAVAGPRVFAAGQFDGWALYTATMVPGAVRPAGRGASHAGRIAPAFTGSGMAFPWNQGAGKPALVLDARGRNLDATLR